MIAAVAAAPAPAPTLEQALVIALTRADQAAKDPLAVLSGSAAETEKIAAVRALHASLPTAKLARQTSVLDALRRAGIDKGQPLTVRREALLHLGYGAAAAGDDSARARASSSLLDMSAEDAVAESALRGLIPATHGVPESGETDFFSRLLERALSGTRRALALQALQTFVASRDDMPKRRPSFLTTLDARLLAPIESAPTAFAGNGDASARAFTLATLWHSARHREAAGDAAPAARLKTLITTLLPLEAEASVRAQLDAYLAAPPATASLL